METWQRALHLKRTTLKATCYSLLFGFEIKDLFTWSRYFSNPPRTHHSVLNSKNLS